MGSKQPISMQFIKLWNLVFDDKIKKTEDICWLSYNQIPEIIESIKSPYLDVVGSLKDSKRIINSYDFDELTKEITNAIQWEMDERAKDQLTELFNEINLRCDIDISFILRNIDEKSDIKVNLLDSEIEYYYNVVITEGPLYSQLEETQEVLLQLFKDLEKYLTKKDK